MTIQLNITGRHIDVTQALREYIAQKLQKLERYSTQPVVASAILSVEKKRHLAELFVTLDNRRFLAKEETEEMYQSIDRAAVTIEKRLKRQKDKARTSTKNLNRNKPTVPSEEIDAENRWTLEEKGEYPVLTLSMGQAVGRLQSGKEAHFVFIDEADEKMKIIKRKKNGKIDCMDLVIE